MALQSMTGFGKGEAEGEKYKVSVEMKSVNHRFKDIRFKMGSLLNSIELPMQILSTTLKVWLVWLGLVWHCFSL